MPKGLTGYRAHLQYYSPRKSWKEILEILHHNKTDIAGKEKDVEGLFQEYAQHEMAHSAFRILRILSVNFVKAEKLIDSVNKTIKFTHMYGLTPNDPNKLRVYPNMEIANTQDHDLFLEACPYYRSDAIEGLIKRINSDMVNPAASKGWVQPSIDCGKGITAIPMARGRARLKRYEDMPIERALMRYSDAKSHYPESTIKEIAGQIEELRLPLELHYAETPEQILYMYSSGPSSCMFVGGKERPWGWMTDIGRHPCDFFAFHPYIRGVYTKVKTKGTVTARTYLYTKEDGKEYHGRIYGSDGRHATALQNALKEQGIKPIPINGETDRNGNAGTYIRECEFRVPGIKHDGDYMLPYPYLDNMRGGLTVSFDKDTHEFIVRCYDGSGYYKDAEGKKKAYHELSAYTGMTNGFITSGQAGNGVMCNQCGRVVSRTNSMYNIAERVTGYRYCSVSCAGNAGRVIARLGNGTQVIVIQEEAYYDKYSRLHFTTEEACRENGGMPFHPDPLVYEEDPMPSTYGYATVGLRFTNGRNADTNQNYSRFNASGKFKETHHKYLEIDFSKIAGVEFIGEIPEPYINENIDPRFGYPVGGMRTRMHHVGFEDDGPYIQDADTGMQRLGSRTANIRSDEEIPVAA